MSDSRLSKPSLFCFGLGYSALALARVLQGEGWRIAGTCRSQARREELAELGIEAWLFDRERPLGDPAATLAGSTYLLSSVPPDAAGDPVIDLCGPAIADMKAAGARPRLGRLSLHDGSLWRPPGRLGR